MNEAVIALMIVTANGIQTGPTFQTYAECEHVSSQIQSQETFCYQSQPVDVNAAIDQMGEVLKQMKEKLDEVRSDNNKEAVSTL
tara:strand:- start:159 stop:410 length:252 start_codon:yes stop_codon:yes gene_type:complete